MDIFGGTTIIQYVDNNRFNIFGVDVFVRDTVLSLMYLRFSLEDRLFCVC